MQGDRPGEPQPTNPVTEARHTLLELAEALEPRQAQALLGACWNLQGILWDTLAKQTCELCHKLPDRLHQRIDANGDTTLVCDGSYCRGYKPKGAML